MCSVLSDQVLSCSRHSTCVNHHCDGTVVKPNKIILFRISVPLNHLNYSTICAWLVALVVLGSTAWITSTEATIVSTNPRFPLQKPKSFSLNGFPLLWPQPTEWHNSDQRYRVTSKVRIRASQTLANCDIVQHNVRKYNAIIRQLIDSVASTNPVHYPSTLAQQNPQQSTETDLHEVYLFVDNLKCSQDVYPNFVDTDRQVSSKTGHNTKSPTNDDWDESYSIEVQANNGKAILYGANVWGAIRALETFSQLLYVERKQKKRPLGGGGGSHRCYQSSQVYVNVSRVWDRPRFRFRSIMIDTARHFIPLSVIMQNLNAMAYNKFNILHWHLSDDQSFPFESKIFQNFSRLAAYSDAHVYSQQDILQVVQHARLQGIQVILELDTPGHSAALGKVFPDLLTHCESIQQKHHYSWSPITTNILDPSNEQTFQVLSTLFQEFGALFKSSHIHLGMDDVSHECWLNNSVIKKFMNEQHLKSMVELEEYYFNRTVKIVNKLGLSQMVWQDIFDKGVKLPSQTIVQVWKDHKLLGDDKDWAYYVQRLVRRKYPIVLSACWFLNIIRYGQDWKDFYQCDPHHFEGEACLWGEYVDGTNLMTRIWPRASAVAERLWSENVSQSLDDVQYRLDGHRCRMISRGIAAQPILNGFCDNYQSRTNRECSNTDMLDNDDDSAGEDDESMLLEYQSSKRYDLSDNETATDNQQLITDSQNRHSIVELNSEIERTLQSLWQPLPTAASSGSSGAITVPPPSNKFASFVVMCVVLAGSVFSVVL